MNRKLNYLVGISFSICSLTGCDRENDAPSTYAYDDDTTGVQASPLVSPTPTPPGNAEETGAAQAEDDEAAYEGSTENPTQRSVSSSTSDTPSTDSVAATSTPQQLDASENIEEEELTIQQVVYFDVNSKELNRETRTKLNDIVEDIKQDESKTAEIRLEAYTDPSGSAEYNKRLAEQRAEAVQEYLKEEGIEDARWKILAVGEEEKRAAYDAANIEDSGNSVNELYTNDAKNERRVVIYVTGL